MRLHSTYTTMLAPFILLASAPLGVLAGDHLSTSGFANCQDNSDIQVQKMNLDFDRSTKKITFDVAGTSAKEQKVMASLIVTAYGKQVYNKTFNPCDGDDKVDQLCPVPQGSFSAQGEQTIPDNYISQVPSIAFTIPDLDGEARLELRAIDGGEQLACITSQVSNGKSLSVPAVSYVAAGMAAAALVVSGLSALAGAGHTGVQTSSPTFFECMTWFQTIQMTGMASVQYPSVTTSWTKNFAFSGGLIYWESMQTSIDSFRNKTGGNLTDDSVEFLKKATLVHTSDNGTVSKRGLDTLDDIILWTRDSLSTSTNSTDSSSSSDNQVTHLVKGIQGYVEELSIPDGNTFMTVLLIFAIVVAAITVLILLFKVILETWALFGSFPKKLTGFRKRYWWLLAKTITQLILLLYGIWVLYCVYQFKNGDSWAAKLLAGVTLTAFTAVLAFFTWKIYDIAHKYQKMEGDVSALYDNKEVWRKYSIFYENYKKSYWWIFVPTIVYLFAKGCVIAGADGHGLAQTAGQMVVESLLLILLLWSRPYGLKSGNWINIFIAVVRVLSVCCVLVFVEELGVAQTTKTVTGLVLVVIQAIMTGLLAILIAVNAIVILCKPNPHKKKRKDAEKGRDLDNLTPLDARNSLLMDPTEYKRGSHGSYEPVPLQDQHTAYGGAPRHFRGDSEHLLSDAASFSNQNDRSNSHTRSISHERSQSPPNSRAPRLPDVDFGAPQQGPYRGHAY